MLKPFDVRTHEKMKEVIMNPEAPGPEVHYYLIRGGHDKKNITIWETGRVGNEYIKTYGHYHVGDISETYWLVYGEGVILLQTRKLDQNGQPIDSELETFRAIKMKAGQNIFIPAGTAHLMANISRTWMVMVDDSPVNFSEVNPITLPGHADYEPIKKMRGFGYYLIEEAGQPKLVKNPSYKIVPEAVIEELKT
jgi:oxalate decarboxylase/phosphoglucose isomerase-like protein (cupin superfamily)